MKNMSRVVPLVVALALSAWPVAASQRGGGGGGGGGGSHGGGGGGGGGSHSGGGGGGGGSHASGGGGSSHVGSGGSGGSVGSGASTRSGGSSGPVATAGSNGSSRSGAAGSGGSGGTAVRRDAGGANAGNAGTSDGTTGGVPVHARPRGNAPVTGTAVPRGSVAPAPGGGTVIVSSYYPWWWFGGVGAYGGYYGLGSYYGWPGYGGYYGGYYDPWFGAYPDVPPPAYSGGGSYSDGGEGALRLKIKPGNAEVYVDGYYVGIVDDFNGIFHKLHIEGGQHRIEVRAPGYESLTFDVQIRPDHSMTYEGELKRVQ